MSLHDLFNAIIDYRITAQDLGLVFAAIALFLPAAFVCVIMWGILCAIGRELFRSP